MKDINVCLLEEAIKELMEVLVTFMMTSKGKAIMATLVSMLFVSALVTLLINYPLVGFMVTSAFMLVLMSGAMYLVFEEYFKDKRR